MQKSDSTYTLVYDGNCAVCRRSADLVRDWDTAGLLQVLPAQTPGLKARFAAIPSRAFEDSVQLIGPTGERWQGAAAIEKLLNLLPPGRFLTWLFKLPLVRPVADRFYRWFAHNRYRPGCSRHCNIQ